MANKLKVEYVMVSPMRRAIETAYHTFKSHPNFSSIKFILCPYMKEAIDTACDVPVNILDIVEEYKGKFENFDTSMLDLYKDPTHYFLYDIDLPFAKNILATKKEDRSDPISSNAFDLICDHIDQNFPKKIEENRNVVRRVGQAKKCVKDLLEKVTLESDAKIV